MLFFFCNFQIEDGYLMYQLEGERVRLGSVRVADGAWHRVEVSWTVSGVSLALDYGLRSATRSLGTKLQGLYVGKILIGGSEDEAEKHTGFTGCIQVTRLFTLV